MAAVTEKRPRSRVHDCPLRAAAVEFMHEHGAAAALADIERRALYAERMAAKFSASGDWPMAAFWSNSCCALRNLANDCAKDWA